MEKENTNEQFVIKEIWNSPMLYSLNTMKTGGGMGGPDPEETTMGDPS